MNSTRVVSNQARKPVVNTLLPKETAPVDGMKACIAEVRRIANVMQPCRCGKKTSNHAWDR